MNPCMFINVLCPLGVIASNQVHYSCSLNQLRFRTPTRGREINPTGHKVIDRKISKFLPVFSDLPLVLTEFLER